MKLNDEMIMNEYNGLKYLQFKKLNNLGIKHAYTLKEENLNFRSNSKEEKESYQRLYDALELKLENFVKPLQNHTGNVRCIDRVVKRSELKETDGLITDKKDIILSTTNADCILFLFYDPKRKVIANVHSGWRGTFQKISEKTILKMMTNYRCNPKDIMCFISPSIRKCHFEVDEDVSNLCREIFYFLGDIDECIKEGEIKAGKQKYFIDTISINKKLMKELGLKDSNIIDSGICSVCNSDKINSYRVEGKGFKLATAVISL